MDKKQNIKRQQCEYARHKLDLKQHMTVEPNVLICEDQKEKTTASENLPKESKTTEWQQILKRWGKLDFSRNRVMIEKFFMLFGLHNIHNKITAPNSQFFSPRENEVSCQPYHYVSVQNVVI